jgi:hypothetical protein
MYDPEVHSICPYCNAGRDTGARAAVSVLADNKTLPPIQAQRGKSATESGATLPPRGYGISVTDDNKTVGQLKHSLGFDPVVGWLVCTDGPDRGKSYDLKGRINSIGRSAKMDVCISGDLTISSENHAKLAYAEKGDAFHIIPADNRNVIYVNGDSVYAPTQLSAHDRIVFGDTVLLFVPLCGAAFRWDKREEDATE